jgi:hypothetical protein
MLDDFVSVNAESTVEEVAFAIGEETTEITESVDATKMKANHWRSSCRALRMKIALLPANPIFLTLFAWTINGQNQLPRPKS